MANEKISELPQVISINNAMEIPVNDAGTTKKVSWGGLLGNVTEGGVATKSANYKILDDDGIEFLYVNTSNGDLTIELPTAVDNEGRRLFIKKIAGTGRVSIDGEVAETIEGDAIVDLILLYDYLDINCNGTLWLINGINQIIDTGWISRSSWVNVHLGSINLDYDNKVGTFVIGEIIVGGGTGDTGIIESNDGTTLVLREVTGNGVFQNNEEITGSVSGTTADVNEPGGTLSAKNLNSDLFHGFGKNIADIDIRLLLSTDGTENNAQDYSFNTFQSPVGGIWANTINQIDTNNFKYQTGESGMGQVGDGGAVVVVAAQDWFYKVIAKRRK